MNATSEQAVVKTGVTVLTPAEVEDQKTRERVQELGREVVNSAVKVGVATINLCQFLRGEGEGSKAIAPGLARKELIENVGLHKAFVSEVLRVSSVSDELWNQYKAGFLGFKKVLQIDRGNIQRLLADGIGDTPGHAEEEIQRGAIGESSPAPTDKPKDPVGQRQNTMALAAKTILKGAEFLAENGQKPKQIAKKWDLANGWMLELRKVAMPPIKETKPTTPAKA